MTVFRAATLRTFFFAIHAGAKELKKKKKTPCSAANKNSKIYRCKGVGFGT